MNTIVTAAGLERCEVCGKATNWRAERRAQQRQERLTAAKIAMPIVDQVTTVITQLDIIRSRLPTILAVERELDQLKLKSRNDVVMWLLLDSISVAVIDAVSVCMRAIKPDGALNQLRHHLPLLKDVRPEDVQTGLQRSPGMSDEHYAQATGYLRREDGAAFNRWRRQLLPQCAGRDVTDEDIEELIQAFLRKTKALREDRHRCRAHRFEEKEANMQAAHLSPRRVSDEIGDLVDYFVVVRGVVGNSSFRAIPRGRGQDPRTAQSIVDLITCGDINAACDIYGVTPKEATEANPRPWYRQKREDFVAAQLRSVVPIPARIE